MLGLVLDSLLAHGLFDLTIPDKPIRSRPRWRTAAEGLGLLQNESFAFGVLPRNPSHRGGG